MRQQAEPRPLGLWDLLAEVNLRDFREMVLAELGLVGASVRQALEARTPGAALALLMALLRLALLVLVVTVFGTGIVAITVVRGAIRAFRTLPRRGG